MKIESVDHNMELEVRFFVGLAFVTVNIAVSEPFLLQAAGNWCPVAR
jgi:hypothetical protein